ncbi:serine protease [Sebaldella sp. S0638]|uniref:S1C family serine protease n=1 Tax=Sebaldella sp. S0638 TaxID=2957809 RepID=UPI0020A121E3|nr:serine protease [Sebaldella sp. S0638]MCP1224829.1 serine protease [Sebaldella sp. S0638]
MKKSFLMLFFLVLLQMSYGADKIKSSIVKIYSTHQQYDFRSPWQNGSDYNSTSTGFIVDGNRIITNAHAVLSNRFLQVRKEGEAKKYKASVEFISEEYDLALIKVDEPGFFNGTVPLKFSGIPMNRDKVAIYGYPMGGDKLSITEGIVSRIEHSKYTLTTEKFLIGQTDAAINPGNSGGPVISKGKVVGVAFSGLLGADNIGYFIPTPIVEHFLNDIKDGNYDGMPKLGIIWSELESPSHRKMLGVENTSTGILIKKIKKNSPLENMLKKGDVLLKLDNYSIEYDGTVEFRKNERTDFNYVVQSKNFGELLRYEIMRDKKKITGEVKLTKDRIPFDLIKNSSFEEPPTYFIYGGLIFEPLTDIYINNSPIKLPEDIDSIQGFQDKKELVVLVRVLSDDVNIGYNNYYDAIITKVNGKSYEDFKDFVKIVKLSKAEFMKFEDMDGNEIVLDTQQVGERNSEIFQNYSIDKEMSADIADIYQ